MPQPGMRGHSSGRGRGGGHVQQQALALQQHPSLSGQQQHQMRGGGAVRGANHMGIPHGGMVRGTHTLLIGFSILALGSESGRFSFL
jgi:hypothetical protein